MNRYSESLEYLTALSRFIKKANPEEILIFFHKFDPEIKTLPEFSDDRIRETLINPIKILMAESPSIQFYKSTIFTVFQKSSIY